MARPGDRIKAARERRNWTQEQLAEAAGISKGFLSDIENDKRNISSESALKIADALGISLDFLLRGETGEREREREPVRIPPELSQFAEEMELSYRATLTLLEAHQAVIARRSAKLVHPPTVEEWRKFYNAIKDVYPDVSGAEE
jgi:transcriptional regulator with XRE-family HTH domain